MAGSDRWSACARFGVSVCAAAIAWTLAASPVLAQVLVVSPDCGVAGSTSIEIKGSGWAEPSPPCEYVFFFDGVEIAPRQDDGLYGPPSATFTIPAGTSAGEHTVKVELRISEDQSLVQCRQTTLCVVTTQKDPWAKGMTVSPNGGLMTIEFDPTDVCDVTPCTDIKLIQTMRIRGQQGGNPPVPLTYSQLGHPNGTDLDANTTGGYTVDTKLGEANPYYNGDESMDIGNSGIQTCGFALSATMEDQPFALDSYYPVNIDRLILDFEVNAFCAAGDDRGTWLGSVTWTWSRLKGGTGVITPGTKSRAQPSATFDSALGTWNQNASHPFSMPQQKAPVKGGEPCH